MALQAPPFRVLDEVEAEPVVEAEVEVEETLPPPEPRRKVTRAKPAPAKAAVAKAPTGSYTVQLGAFSDRGRAMKVAQLAKRKTKALRGGEIGVSASRARKNLYVAQVVGLGRNDAEAACSRLRRQRQPCLVLRQNDTVIGSD